MISEIENIQDFIKVSCANGEISERCGNELLRLTNETIQIGLN